MKKIKSRSARIEKYGTSVDYTEHLAVGERDQQGAHTLRIHVHVDFYQDQSHGEVDRWNGERWHRVVSLRGCALATDTHLHNRLLPPDASDFKADRDTLLQLTREVL